MHLYTHQCTSKHSMRQKYRSAIYTFDPEQQKNAQLGIVRAQKDFSDPIITKVLPFKNFRLNKTEYLNYYFNNPEKPFCKTYIDPKLKLLMSKYSSKVKKLNQI